MRAKPATPVLVVDLGFSAGKFRWKDVEDRVPSAFRRTGEIIIVGDDALRGTGSNYLKTPEELVRYYPNFVDHIHEAAGVDEKADLAIGLPYDYWKNELEKGDHPSSAIVQLQETLKRKHFGKIHVFPQGRGGLVAYIADSKVAVEGNVLVIDIGFNTIIATLFSVKQQKTLWTATYYKKGIHRLVTEYLYPRIKDLTPGRSATPVELARFLEDRFIQFGFERHDIGPEIDAAAESYAADTLKDIDADLKAHVGVTARFDEVLLFGGGTHYLPDIHSSSIQITKLQAPEFANARGFEILAQKHAEEV
ncbi:MAG: ParM/StbA family protein [Geobacter sp.]|nr:MAG: ParM/StbA family protein [Geobacter sp.]